MMSARLEPSRHLILKLNIFPEVVKKRIFQFIGLATPRGFNPRNISAMADQFAYS